MGWLAGYKYRRPYVIPAANVKETNAAWTSFIRIDADAVFGAHIVDAVNFTDFVFTDSDGVAPLSFERKNPVVAAGAFSADYFAGHGVTNATAQTVYAYYGKAGDADHEDADAAWDANYVGVWHLEEAVASGFADSTSNNNDGTGTGVAGQDAGKIGYGVEFDTAADRITCGSGASLDNLTNRTIELWVWPDSGGTGTTFGRALGKNDNAGWIVLMNYSQAKMSYFQKFATGNYEWLFDTTAEWQHLAITYDGDVAGAPVVLRNGVSVALTRTGTASGAQGDDSAGALVIGNRAAGDRTFDGKIDEVTVSNVVRSANWVTMRYTNMNAPATWGAWGAEESFVRIPMYYAKRRRAG